MLRFLTAGESHGPGLVTVVEGLPKGLEFSRDALAAELARRRLGFGRSNRMKLEKDELEILGGVRHGKLLGSPVSVLIRNTEWARWQEDMSPDPGEPTRTLTTPRPGHADLVGMQKYDTRDARDIIERSSARETAARTVAGYLAKTLLSRLGVSVFSHTVAIGSVTANGDLPGPDDLAAIDENPVRSHDADASERMVAEIERAKSDRDTLGGVIEILAHGVPPGLGSHVHWDRRLDGLLAGALMSIHAMKGVEFGDGFTSATRRGSEAHDEIFYRNDTFVRNTDRAGGIEGGMTTGQPIRVRVAMKPISTLMRPLETVDVATKKPDVALRERSDVCAVPRAGVVCEQMVAIVLAQEMQRMVGGDTIADVTRNHAAYLERLASF